MKALRLLFLLLGLVALAYFLSSYGPSFFRAQPQTSLITTCCDQREGLRELDFPYYSLREGFASQLFLVSTTDRAMDVTVAVYSQHGASVLSPVTIQPDAKLAIDLRAFLTQNGADVAGEFGEGSVAVYFEGTMMPVTGQITVANAALRLVHESEALENDPGRTDIPVSLNGAWWNLAPGRDARIMVANMSPDSVTADVYLDYLGERHPSAPLTFVPHELKVLSITDLLGEQKSSPAQAPAGGITIVQQGDNPRLAAQGKMLDATTGFSTTMHFPSPQLETASALHAVGIPVGKPSGDSPFVGLGNFTPHVVIRNLLSTPQTAVVTVEYPRVPGWDSHAKRARPGDQSDPSGGAAANPGGFTGQLALAPLTLAAYSTEDVSLDSVLGQLPQPLPYVSIRIQHSGAAGSMVAEISSVEQQKDVVIDAKVQNEGNGWAGSGGNPWHLDNDTESYAFLANMGDKPARIGYRVWADGQNYFLDSLELLPHETRMIDLRKLRDAQEADFLKHTIHAGATDGSVLWIRLDNVPVMGRVAEITRHGGVASSYDCCMCACPGQYEYTTESPANSCPIPVSINDQVTAQAAFIPACGGSQYFYNITTSTSWSSTITSIFTLSNNPKGLLHSLAAGTASALAQGPTECYAWYMMGGVCQCSQSAPAYGSTSCSVGDVTPVITSITSPWPAGQTTPGTIMGQHFGASPSVSISDSTINFSYSPAGDGQINFSAVVPSGKPIETVVVTVTSNGYYGSGFMPIYSGEPQSASGNATAGSGQSATITLTRQSLTSTSASGSPSSVAASPAFTYSASGSGNIASYTTQNANANPNTASINAPSNPGGAVTPGGLATLTATYNTTTGAHTSKSFSAATFGLSCYYTALETDWGDATQGTCSTVYIAPNTYSGSSTNPSGLPARQYCNSFLAIVMLQGSGVLKDNATKIQYSSGSYPSWIFRVVSTITASDGTPPVAGQTLARDPNIIPGRSNTHVQLPNGTYLANDVGGKIVGYILDLYEGTGKGVCVGFVNSIVVGTCDQVNSTCPGYTIQ